MEDIKLDEFEKLELEHNQMLQKWHFWIIIGVKYARQMTNRFFVCRLALQKYQNRI